MGRGIGNTAPLPPVMWYWINNWKTLSRFAIDCKDREDREEMADDPELLLSVRDFEVNSRDDVARLMGLIMRKKT